MADPVRDHQDGATVRLRVIPRAPSSALAGRYGDAVKLKVAAPPNQGVANDEVRRFVADLVGVRVAEVELLAGARARDKVVLIRGISAARLRSVLL